MLNESIKMQACQAIEAGLEERRRETQHEVDKLRRDMACS